MKKAINKNGVIYIIRVMLQLVFAGILYFVSAGTLQTLRGWTFFGTAFFVYLISTILCILKNPDLINNRATKKDNTRSWDWPLLLVYWCMAFCAIYIVAGLDARFGWSVMPLVTLIPGLLLYTISAVLGGWALIVNKHFEATARIQKDREHTVITSGPYKLVRHPGYLSALLGVAAVPLVLGSYVAFSCSIVVCFVMAIRTRLEDRMLRQELKGYSDYAEKVRYRLVPFIW